MRTASAHRDDREKVDSSLCDDVITSFDNAPNVLKNTFYFVALQSNNGIRDGVQDLGFMRICLFCWFYINVISDHLDRRTSCGVW